MANPTIISASTHTNSFVQAVSSGFTVTISGIPSTLWKYASGINSAASTTMSVGGVKLEETFLSTNQLVDTVKRVPFIDGTTGALVNSVTAGTITFRAARCSNDAASGDLILFAALLQKAGSSTPVNIEIAYQVYSAGVASPEKWTFSGCLIERVPPMMLMGNDVAVYDIVFSYDDFAKTS